MKLFKLFKKTFRITRDNKLIIMLQSMPIITLLLIAYYVPAVINPLFGNRSVNNYTLLLYNALSIALLLINSLLLTTHNIFIKGRNKVFKLRLGRVKAYLIRVVTAGLIINSLFAYAYQLFIIPSIIILFLTLYTYQFIIIKDYGIIKSFKESAKLSVNKLSITLELMSLIYIISIINWLPYGPIIALIIQPNINLTTALIFKKIT